MYQFGGERLRHFLGSFYIACYNELTKGNTMEFNKYFNPGTIVATVILLIAVLGMIGNKLTERDNKRGYCDLPEPDKKDQ